MKRTCCGDTGVLAELTTLLTLVLLTANAAFENPVDTKSTAVMRVHGSLRCPTGLRVR